MTTPANLRHVSLVEVLDAIGSSEPSSGAGIAAAVALALATSCALKAVGITLKRGPDDALEQRAALLLAQRDRALERAEVDAHLFGQYMANREPRDAAMLVVAAADFQALAKEVAVAIDDLDARVLPSVVSDVTAARQLHSAAVDIEALIKRSSRELQSRTMP
ncbi:MAG: hypothetical protein ABW278_04690 [Steroidobacteraceae bacterium]